jgi:hypothetical protein
MLRIDMLPAAQGDALWIEYGDEQSLQRILIDGGTKGSWENGLRARIAGLPADDRHFELLVVTHIDADHIDGALRLLQDETLGATFGDVWFNGWRHLPETLEPLGPVAGELLTDAIVDRGLAWNDAFGGDAVVVPDAGALPRVELAGEFSLTVLGPGLQQLRELRPVWEEALEEAGLDPEKPRPEPEEEEEDRPDGGLERLGARPNVAALAASAFSEDSAEPNGSSIVLLLEHDGKSALLTADAFPSVVLAGVNRLVVERAVPRLAVDAFKVPHHGSRFNLSPALAAALDCNSFLFSTNGMQTQHPHLESVARTILATGQGSTLLFNYATTFNEPWDDEVLEDQNGYAAVFPKAGTVGLSVPIGED